MREFRWNVAQIAICAGVVCVVVGFASNLVGVVYAQSCANLTVRSNSPCLSGSWSACRKVGLVCPTDGTTNYGGNFQCDQPNSGTTCVGTGVVYMCFDRYTCMMSDHGACDQDPYGDAYAEDAETVKQTNCAG
jgi:hypothetical protein